MALYDCMDVWRCMAMYGCMAIPTARQHARALYGSHTACMGPVDLP